MGIFITFEGGDGSGKTTIIKRLAYYLEEKGKEVVLTRDPGGTRISDQIRAILLDSKNTELTEKSELMLYQCARSQLLTEVIIPALKKENVIVLCDRFMDSTRVYQGMVRECGRYVTDWFEKFVVGFHPPDKTFFLDVDPEVGLYRSYKALEGESGDEARMENEGLSFHEKVQQGFHTLAKMEPNRFTIIDANEEEDMVFAAVCLAIDEYLCTVACEKLCR